MLSRIEELKLVARCLVSDDRDAFGRLVEAYQGRLRRFFLNLTMGDAALSDDLAQESFIKAYINLRSFRGLSSFGTWLYRIGYNEFYSWARRHHEQPEAAGRDWAINLVSCRDEAAADARHDARVMMSCLSADERAIVALFYIDDQPIARIATIMRLPAGTVKSKLHRAKEKMRSEAIKTGIDSHYY